MKHIISKYLLVTLLAIMPYLAYADVPGTISFQGYLSDDSGNAVNGTTDITFSIVDTSWNEEHNNVPVNNGVFSVQLGSKTAFGDSVDFSKAPKWLEMTFENGSSQRVQFSTVPYAFHAKTVEPGIYSQFKPHNKQIKWAVNKRTVENDIDLGLDSTNAKYIMAMVYATASENDHANHLFGKAFPGCNSWDNRSPTHYYNCNSEPSSDSYVVMTHNGQQAGEDHYGIHKFLIIPLKNNQRINVVLGDGYTSGTHYIKMRIIGYIE
jgi:hypothetical protein